ncbi:hypothetical protein C266_19258 [Pandoraea sp. SD6-2]|nr:hypothetical protein C266_19258 [Pandoraea sp. SD6-2]
MSSCRSLHWNVERRLASLTGHGIFAVLFWQWAKRCFVSFKVAQRTEQAVMRSEGCPSFGKDLNIGCRYSVRLKLLEQHTIQRRVFHIGILLLRDLIGQPMKCAAVFPSYSDSGRLSLDVPFETGQIILGD